MNESGRIKHWIKSALGADQQLVEVVGQRIFADQAESGTQFPYIVFSLQTGASGDIQGPGTARILTRPIYLIKVVCEGSPTDTVRLAADRIDEIIGKAVNQSDLGFNFSARRNELI